MGRLKRSCVAGSVVFHTLILALLFLGPVLLAKRETKVQVIDLVPSEIVDQIIAPTAPVAPPTPPTPPTPNPPKPTPPKLSTRGLERGTRERSEAGLGDGLRRCVGIVSGVKQG